MWLRRAFFWWMFPAVLALPLWLLVGWMTSGANGWALVGVLFVAMPSVFLAQLILALLVRARGTVRAERAVSWWDVLGFGVWHVLIVVVGLFSSAWSSVALVLALVGTVALFWLTLWQLWRDTTGSFRAVLRSADGTAYIPPARPTRAPSTDGEVIVVTERSSRE